MGGGLDVQDLTVVRPDGVEVLSEVSLRVEPGQALAVLGASGGGKSTLVRALVGLLPKGWRATGRARLGDTELLELEGDAWCAVRGRRIGVVFQEPLQALLPTRRVLAQVALALRAAPRATRQARALDALRRAGFEAPEVRGRAFPHELSGGERQRVLIALALAQDPELVLADEPISHLDPPRQVAALGALRAALKIRGAALLLVGHDVMRLATVADRVLVLHEGRVVEQGEMQYVLRNPQHPHTAALLEAVPRAAEEDG